jgi:hypothetical protein
MTFSKLSVIAGFIVALTLMFESAAHATEYDQLTKITFSQPVQVSGQVLLAGTYEFVLANSSATRDMVRIFNADGTELVTTLQTVPIERAKVTDGTAITLAERGDGQPAAVMTWFYPGEDTGHEFVYPKQVEAELAQDAKQTFVGNHGINVAGN